MRWYDVAVALSLAAGCGPKVNVFEVSTRYVCPPETVELRWSVVGAASLSAEPAVAGLTNGPVDDDGKVTLLLQAPTQIDLRVTRCLGHPTTRTKKLELLRHAPLTASLGDATASPGCDGARFWATVHATHFSPAMKVRKIKAHDGDRHTYTVGRGGSQVMLAPGADSEAFAGETVNGEWSLSATLLDGERCDAPTRPRNVVIDILTHCEGTP